MRSGYVDGVQTNRVLPQANILANLEAIDQLFFIEAALRRQPVSIESVFADVSCRLDVQQVHLCAGQGLAVSARQCREQLALSGAQR